VDLTRAIVTADALHTQGKTAQIIVEGGGDYILPLKGNQPSIVCGRKTAACTAKPFQRQTSPSCATPCWP